MAQVRSVCEGGFSGAARFPERPEPRRTLGVGRRRPCSTRSPRPTRSGPTAARGRRGVRRRARGGAAGVRGSGRGDGGGGGGEPRRRRRSERPGVQGLRARRRAPVRRGPRRRRFARPRRGRVGAVRRARRRRRVSPRGGGGVRRGERRRAPGGDPDAAAADLADAAIDPLIAKVCAVKLGEDDSTGGFDERSSEEDPGTRGSALVDAGLEALAKTCEAAPAAVWSDAWARNGATFWLARLARDPNPARRASAWRLLAVAASPARARRRVCWLGRGRRRRARRRARRWISTRRRRRARRRAASSRRVSPRWPPRTRTWSARWRTRTRPWTSSRS